jgi:hypothetical protein
MVYFTANYCGWRPLLKIGARLALKNYSLTSDREIQIAG